MTARELKYDFLLKKDRVQSLSTANFNDAEIDWFLNEAQMVFIKQRLSNSNSRRASYEQIQKRTDDLSTLHIKYPLQPSLPLIPHTGVYELPLSSLAYPYLQFLAGSLTIKLPSCNKEVPIRFTQTDDLSEVLRDPFNEASAEDFVPFNFGRSSVDDQSSIFVYPSIYTPISIDIEYIKHPQKIFQGTYTYIDNTIPPESTTDLPEHTHTEVVDIAV